MDIRDVQTLHGCEMRLFFFTGDLIKVQLQIQPMHVRYPIVLASAASFALSVRCVIRQLGVECEGSASQDNGTVVEAMSAVSGSQSVYLHIKVKRAV